MQPVKALLVEDGSYFLTKWAQHFKEEGFNLGMAPLEVAMRAKTGLVSLSLQSSVMHVTASSSAFVDAIQKYQYALCLITGSAIDNSNYSAIAALLCAENPPVVCLMSDAVSDPFRRLLAKPEIVASCQKRLLSHTPKGVLGNIDTIRRVFGL